MARRESEADLIVFYVEDWDEGGEEGVAKPDKVFLFHRAIGI